MNKLLLSLPALAWLVVFAVVPLGFMLVMSFWSTSIMGISFEFTLRNYERLADSWLYAGLLWKTVRIALITTLITLVLSYPLAVFLARLQGVRRASLIILLFLPFWTSYVVRTFAWLPILGRNGLINQALIGLGVIDQPLDWLLYREWVVWMGLVYVYMLFMTLPIFLSIDRIDRALYDAAADLGASRWDMFRRITWPLSLPGVISGSIMCALLALGAFITPALLGGTSGIMIGNVIAAQFINDMNWAFGSALGIALTAVVLLLIAIANRTVGVQRIFLGRV